MNALEEMAPFESPATTIDEAMLPVAEFVAQMTDLEGSMHDAATRTRLQLDSIRLSIPIELDLQVKGDGTVQLGGSPPLYYVETTILPVFHQLTISITIER